MISVVVPHLSSSKYIDYFKKKLEENTETRAYELVEIVDETDVYYAYNKGVYQSKYESVVLMNDDMVVSPNWDRHFLSMIKPGRVVTGHVIEPNPGTFYRRNGVGFSNTKYDCGSSVQSFNYDKFAKFAEDFSKKHPPFTPGFGWYMPVGFHKSTYVSYPNIKKFPYPNDCHLLDEILPMMNYDFVQVNSTFYHFQSKSWK
jgi:hypothetical protein